ncbi:MAG: hypothetical protein ACYC6L_09365 [Anaerolineae bacterium]
MQISKGLLITALLIGGLLGIAFRAELLGLGLLLVSMLSSLLVRSTPAKQPVRVPVEIRRRR